MRLGKAFCLSGICLVAVALALACCDAHARAVVSPSELDGVVGGVSCGRACSEDAYPGCAPDEETGPCELQSDPVSGQYCPPEEWREACPQDEYWCVGTAGSSWCVRQETDCPGWYLKHNCVRDNNPYEPNPCVWLSGQYYACQERDDGTYYTCTDNS